MSLFFIVSVIQGAGILFDEFYFHRKRGLPKWERIGHPIDTLSVVACLLFLAFVEKNSVTVWIFAALATASCILVTKDEWVHKNLCPPEEMWLHAVCFMVHPLLLFTGYIEWEDSRPMILAVAGGVSVFFFYQIVYWNIVEPKLQKKKPQRRPIHQPEDLYEYFGE